MGSQTLELEYRGPNHNPGNIFIYAPKQKVLLLIDVVFPGWSPFLELAITTSPFDYVKSHDDIQDNAAQALQTVDFFGVAEETGFENPWLLFGTYLDRVGQECASLTHAKWSGVLGGADLFTESHCGTLVEALRVE